MEPEKTTEVNELEETKTLIKGIVGESVKEQTDAMKEEIKTFLAEQKELMSKEAGVYEKDIKKDREFLNKYFRSMSKALLSGDEVSLKEMTTDGTGTPYAGYVVDSELSAEIRHLVTEYGVARREMTTLQMSKGSYKANELVTDVTVSWTDEASAMGSTQVVLGQKSFELEKLTAIVTMTNELLADEEIDLFGFVSSRVAEGFANKEDEACFNGDGTATYGGFTGLLNSLAVNTTTMAGTTFASLDADDLLDMIEDSPQSVRGTGKFYMNFSIMNLIRKLKDEDKNYIFQAPSESGPATVWGRPVVLVEVMPGTGDSDSATPFIIYGDLKKGCYFGFKGGMEAKRFDAGIVKDVAGTGTINLITEDRQAIRITERVGYFQVITSLAKPITVLKTASASA